MVRKWCRYLAYWTVPAVLIGSVVFSSPKISLALSPGERTPDFYLSSQSGSTSLSKFAGKVVYLDFWASWCPGCRRSVSWINQLQEKYGPRGLQVVAVNLDTVRADAETVVKELSSKIVVMYDPDGTVPSQFDIPGMPTAYLIDTNGVVAKVVEGSTDGEHEAAEAKIRSLLGIKPDEISS